jgi:PAS domain S-box-containing protein
LSSIGGDKKMAAGERRFLSMFQSVTTGVVELSLDGRILHFNGDFARMLGYGADELDGRSLLELVHPADREKCARMIDQLATGKIHGADLVERFITRDGATLWSRILANLMRDEYGRPDHVVLVVHDFGDRRLAEGVHQLTEERLEAFYAAGMEAIIMTRGGVILDANRQAAEMLGTSLEALIGRNIQEFVADRERPRLQALVDEGGFVHAEFEVQCCDGRTIYVEAQGQQTEAGSDGASFTIVRDISTYRHRERELHRLNRTLKAMRESSMALLRASDEQTYMHQVCNIIADQCGYFSVGIGLLEPSDGDSLVTRAWVSRDGTEPPLIRPAHLSDGDEGPTMRAIRSGRTVLCQDLQADPTMPDWRKTQARQYRFAAMVAVPLVYDELAFGVINILSDTKNHFSAEEVTLLQGLADDLAIGIHTLRLDEARRKSEEALARKSRELETLFDTIPAMVYVKDCDLRYLKVNRRFCQEMGMSQETIVGRRDGDFSHPALARACYESDMLALEEGGFLDREEFVREPDGSTRWWSTSKRPFRDGEPHVVGLIGVSSEITERKLVENERFNRLKEQRYELVREVHHRIKNHLQGVVGLLRTQIQHHPEGALPLEETVSQVLSIAEVYGLQSRRSDSRVEMQELLEAIVSLPVNRNMIHWRNRDGELTLFLDNSEAVPVAMVLNELLTNAVKHLDEPGEQPNVVLSLERDGGRVRIRILNQPARLPPGFNFREGRGLGTGLELIRSLLPRPGAELTFSQSGDCVLTELILKTPVIVEPD